MTNQYRVVDGSYKTQGVFSSKTAAAKFIKEQRAAGKSGLGMVADEAPKKAKATAKAKTTTKPRAPAKPKAAPKPKTPAKPKAPAKPREPAKPKAAPKPKTPAKPKASAKGNGLKRVRSAGFETMQGVPGIDSPRIEAQPDGTFLVLFPEFRTWSASQADRDLWAARKAGELNRGTGWGSFGEGATLLRMLEEGDGFFDEVDGYANLLSTSGWWSGGCATIIWREDGTNISLYWVGKPEEPVRAPGRDLTKPYSDVGHYLASRGLPPLFHYSFEVLWERTAGKGRTLEEAFANEPWISMLPECERTLAEGMGTAMGMTTAEAAAAMGVDL